MTRWFRILLLASVMAVASGNVHAGDNYGVKIGKKLGTGLANIATSWLEVPKSMINTYNQANLVFGLTGGLAKGLVNMGGRIVTGAIDVATFPLPTKPIPQPALIWKDFDQDTHYGEAFRLDLNNDDE